MAKSRSVQEQNRLQKEAVLNEACYWREHPQEIPPLVQTLIAQKNIDLQTCIFHDLYDSESMGGNWISGVVMTADYRVFDFEIEYDDFVAKRFVSLRWSDVTAQTNFSARNKGFGKGKGCLMKEVLQELNGLPPSGRQAV